MILVPDASVILKWVLQREEEADFQLALRMVEAFQEERIDIRVPSLWQYEVGNVLGMKQPHFAAEAMETLLGYQFEEVPLRQDYCLAVLRFMREVKGITFYDAAYHVLAIQAKGVYVTADHAYLRKAQHKRHITLLSEWKAPS